MLVLFDIDGTLLSGSGVGMRAMAAAGRELFGSRFTFGDIHFAGSLDSDIWRKLAQTNTIQDTPERHDSFRSAYIQCLQRRLAAGDPVHSLPGVTELLAGLALTDGVSTGLLTGNYEESGWLKIEAAGLDPAHFEVGAWGTDGDTREELPRVARDRFHRRTGRRVELEDIVIVGDTPRDIECARANGCRALAVATGRYSPEELSPHRPHHLVDDLTATTELLDWITTPGFAST